MSASKVIHIHDEDKSFSDPSEPHICQHNPRNVGTRDKINRHPSPTTDQ